MSPFLKLRHLRPPVRRVLALDAGSRCLKLLLAQSDFGRLRILKEELIDLQAEGLVSADETKTHLQATLDAWGRPPLAVVLPQHLSISQVVDLPLAPESEVEKLIHDETVKLGGVSDSRIVYDFVRTETSAKNRQQFWVTLCQEGDILERVQRLGVEQDDLCDVTSTANALIAAYRVACPLSSRAILVHLGAQSTLVVILLAGQGAFASSFQMGGDFFTRALARLRSCSEETAESLKRECILLEGPDAFPDFAGVVDGWVEELKRQLKDWFAENPGFSGEVVSFEMVASGGGFEQPGLLDYLRNKAGLDLHPWPKSNQPEAVNPSRRFEIAFGTALQALGHCAQPVSLLPDDYRAAWRKRVGRQKFEFASFALVGLCFLFLAAGTWHKLSLAHRKQALLNKVSAAQEAVRENEALSRELAKEYENIRPVFAGQQNTLDTLKTLDLLQQSRSNRSLWYVLLADQQTYFNPPASLFATNKLTRTNSAASFADRMSAVVGGSPVFAAATTNSSPAKPGLIAELCVPEQAEAARAVLSQLVNELKQQALFAKVDLLSDDLRRNLADPKVVLPDRHFVLALDFAAAEFQQPLIAKPVPISSSPRGGSKHAVRVRGSESGDRP